MKTLNKYIFKAFVKESKKAIDKHDDLLLSHRV